MLAVLLLTMGLPSFPGRRQQIGWRFEGGPPVAFQAQTSQHHPTQSVSSHVMLPGFCGFSDVSGRGQHYGGNHKKRIDSDR
jgi:hypothetical protein